MPIKNIVTNQRVTKEKLERAKELRREMTPAEKILWQELRASKLVKSM
jgi:very-short-patch-repair endonuclease